MMGKNNEKKSYYWTVTIIIIGFIVIFAAGNFNGYSVGVEESKGKFAPPEILYREEVFNETPCFQLYYETDIIWFNRTVNQTRMIQKINAWAWKNKTMTNMNFKIYHVQCPPPPKIRKE